MGIPGGLIGEGAALLGWESGAGTPSDFYAAVTAEDGRCYLVELYPYKRGATNAPSLPLRTIGTQEDLIGYDQPLDPTAGIVELDYSDAGYVSPHVGAKPDTYFDGRVTQPLRLSRTLPVAPEGSRRVLLEVAGVELINTDGDLDSMLNEYAIDGRRVVVKIGKKTGNYETFTTIYSGRAAMWKGDFKKVDVTARDEAYRLNVPLQSTLYTGAGGINGTAEMEGKSVPVCFGKCINISPPLIDPPNLVFQFHARQGQAVDAVYDRGAALTPTGNHANYAALTGAALSAGQYATCLALGVFRVGSVPSGLVAADVQGDAAGSYVSTTFAVARRLLTGFAGLAEAELDGPLFDYWDSVVTGTMGWYRGTESISAESAVSEIIGHCSAYWGGLSNGLLSVGRLEAPDASAIATDLQVYDVREARRVDAPPGSYPPRSRQRVSFAKRWAIQRGEDLAASVTAARRQFLAEPFSVVSASSPDAASDFLLAQDPPVLETLFANEVDAQAEANRLIALFGVPRSTVDIVQGLEGHLITLSGTQQLTFPRVNFGSAWLARAVGQEIDAGARTITTTLWG